MSQSKNSISPEGKRILQAMRDAENALEQAAIEERRQRIAQMKTASLSPPVRRKKKEKKKKKKKKN